MHSTLPEKKIQHYVTPYQALLYQQIRTESVK